VARVWNLNVTAYSHCDDECHACVVAEVVNLLAPLAAGMITQGTWAGL
jgi:hypothetical protein